MEKRILKGGIIGVVIILAIFWLALFMEGRGPKAESPIVPSQPDASSTPSWIAEGYLRYEDSAGLFSVFYPPNFIVEASSTNSLFAPGVSFVVPEDFTEGTNLSSDSRIYLNSISTDSCSADIFVSQASENQVPISVSMNGRMYSVLSFSDAGAGNRYETTIYAFSERERCYAMMLFMHTTNVGNYDPGTIEEFDRYEFMGIFEKMLESFEGK